jgi:peptide subunit release factor 1 (eRF1)
MAEVLDASDRRQEKLRLRDYEKYLKDIIELAKNVAEPEHLRSAILKLPSNTKAKQALYDNLEWR